MVQLIAFTVPDLERQAPGALRQMGGAGTAHDRMNSGFRSYSRAGLQMLLDFDQV